MSGLRAGLARFHGHRHLRYGGVVHPVWLRMAVQSYSLSALGKFLGQWNHLHWCCRIHAVLGSGALLVCPALCFPNTLVANSKTWGPPDIFGRCISHHGGNYLHHRLFQEGKLRRVGGIVSCFLCSYLRADACHPRFSQTIRLSRVAETTEPCHRSNVFFLFIESTHVMIYNIFVKSPGPRTSAHINA